MTTVTYTPEAIVHILAELSTLCEETILEIAVLNRAAPGSDERAEISGDLSVKITHLKVKASLIEEAMESKDWSI